MPSVRVFVFALALVLTGDLDAKTRLRILFVGNSLTYSNDLPGMVRRMADADVSVVAKPNYSLGDHLAEAKFVNALKRSKWDVIVLQQGPSSRDDSRRMLIEDARRVATLVPKNTRIALLMVWPATRDASVRQRVADSYALAAEAVGGVLIPAGTVLHAALDRDPALPLLGDDAYHPTPEGTYVMALATYAVLYGPLPDSFATRRVAERMAGTRLRMSEEALRLVLAGLR